DRKNVEVILKSPVSREHILSLHAGCARISRSMYRAIDPFGFADALHDVNLAAFGPATLIDVVSKQPKRGPYAFAGRQFYSCFETAVHLAELALRFQTRRGIAPANPIGTGIVLFDGADGKHSVLFSRILDPS